MSAHPNHGASVETLVTVWVGAQKDQKVRLTKLGPGAIGVVKHVVPDFVLVRFPEGWAKLSPYTGAFRRVI